MLQNLRLPEIIKNIITNNQNRDFAITIGLGTFFYGMFQSIEYYSKDKINNSKMPIGFVKNSLPIANIISNLVLIVPIATFYALFWPITVPLTQLFYISKNFYDEKKYSEFNLKFRIFF